MTFLSPVEVSYDHAHKNTQRLTDALQPTSLVNQSMPFSYMAVTAAPSDGKAHSVQIYTDISSEWVSGNDAQKVNWTTTTGDVIIHQAQLQNQTLFSDSGDRIQCEALLLLSSLIG